TRAIVTEIPGTTRDTIEENISIKGIPVKLTDTAGIRETSDVIEKIGIEKSKESFNQADLVIFILDSSRELEDEDLEIMDLINPEKTIILLNKIDLIQKIKKEEILEKMPGVTLIETSMAKRMGIDEIEKKIVDLVYGGKISQNNNVMVTNVRHKDILEKSRQSISDAINMINLHEALEFIEIDVNSAYESLGEIIGETVQDDIINEVFARFCLGK
ncbi:MAG: GTP-binding protein, partial [Clostridia bacterium]|nr:GTP-binding protein [Clostridia bacterium]